MSQSLCFVNPKIPHSIHRNISFSAYAVIWLIHWLAMLVLSVSIPAFLSFAEPAPVIFFEVSLLAFHSCLLPALSSSALLHALLPKWFLRLFSLSCFSNPHSQVLNGQHCTWSLCHPALTCMSSLLPPSHRCSTFLQHQMGCLHEASDSGNLLCLFQPCSCNPLFFFFNLISCSHYYIAICLIGLSFSNAELQCYVLFFKLWQNRQEFQLIEILNVKANY